MRHFFRRENSRFLTKTSDLFMKWRKFQEISSQKFTVNFSASIILFDTICKFSDKTNRKTENQKNRPP